MVAAANRPNSPRRLAFDPSGNRLFVADYTNNRVMVFDVGSITNGENAANVLGQTTFTTSIAARQCPATTPPWAPWRIQPAAALALEPVGFDAVPARSLVSVGWRTALHCTVLRRRVNWYHPAASTGRATISRSRCLTSAPEE